MLPFCPVTPATAQRYRDAPSSQLSNLCVNAHLAGHRPLTATPAPPRPHDAQSHAQELRLAQARQALAPEEGYGHQVQGHLLKWLVAYCVLDNVGAAAVP
eukprot:scaffold95461_cov65-Phaeocystis_antarctica.AAC.1